MKTNFAKVDKEKNYEQIITNSEKFTNLKTDIEKLSLSDKTKKELDDIKKSFAELETLTLKNNLELDEAPGKEKSNDVETIDTCDQLRKQLEKQKNLNHSLSLKLRSIHIKLNNVCFQRSELEQNLNRRIKEIENQIVNFSKILEENENYDRPKLDGSSEKVEIEREIIDELVLKNELEIDKYQECEIGNEKKRAFIQIYDNKEKEQLQKLLKEYEWNIEAYKINKMKLDFELKCCQTKLNEEIEKNIENINKIKNYEINMNLLKSENVKITDELNYLKVEVEKSNNKYKQVDIKKKFLDEENNNLVELNDELQNEIKNIKNSLNNFKNREQYLTNFVKKINSIIMHLKNNNEYGYYNGDLIRSEIDNKQTLLMQTDVHLDIILTSIKRLLLIKKKFKEKSDELEEIQCEFESLKNEYLGKKKCYEELKIQLEHLKRVEQENLKIMNEKANCEDIIKDLKDKLNKEQKEKQELQEKENCNISMVKDFEKKETCLLNEINKLKILLDQKAEDLNKYNEKKNIKLEKYKTKNDELVKNLVKINEELNKYNNQITVLTKNVKLVQEEKASIINDLNSAKNYNNNLKKQMRKMERQNKLYQLKTDRANSIISNLTKKLSIIKNTFDAILTQFKNCKKEYKEEIAKKEEQFNYMKSHYDSLKEELATKNENLRKNVEHIKNVESDLTYAKKKNDELNEELKKYNNSIQSKNKEIDWLSNMESELLKKKEVNETLLSEKDHVIKDYENELHILKEENNNLMTEILRLKNTLKEKEGQEKIFFREMEIYKNEKKKTISTLEKKLTDKENLIARMNEEITKLQKEISNNIEKSNEIKTLNHKIEELTTVKDKYELKFNELNNELQTISHKLKTEELLREEDKKEHAHTISLLKEHEIKLKEKENVIELLKKNEQGLEKKIETEKEAIEKNYKDVMASLKKKCEKKMDDLKTKHIKDMQNIKDEFNKKIESVKAYNICSEKDIINKLRDQQNQLTNENKSLREKQHQMMNERNVIEKKFQTEKESILKEYEEKEKRLKKEIEEEKEVIIEDLKTNMKIEKEKYEESIHQLNENFKNDTAILLEQHKTEISKLKQMYESSIESESILKDNEQKLKNKIEEYEKELKEKEEEIKRIVEEFNEKLEKQNKDMELLLEECEEKLRKAKTNKKGDTKFSAYELENSSTTKQLAQKESQIEQLVKELEESKKEINDLNVSNNINKNEIQKLKEEKEILLIKNKKLNDKISMCAIYPTESKEKELSEQDLKGEKLDKKESDKIKKNEEITEKTGETEKREKTENTEEIAETERVEDVKGVHKDKEVKEEKKKKKEKKSEKISDKQGDERSSMDCMTDIKYKTDEEDKREDNKHKAVDETNTNELIKESLEQSLRIINGKYKLKKQELNNLKIENIQFLQSVKNNLNEIINIIKTKDTDAGLMEDALNKINYALNPWGIFVGGEEEEAKKEEEKEKKEKEEEREKEKNKKIRKNEECGIFMKEIEEQIEVIKRLVEKLC